MRQLVFEAAGRYSWRSAPDPVISSPQQALVRPLMVACCDLDVGVARGALPMPPGHAVGHEEDRKMFNHKAIFATGAVLVWLAGAGAVGWGSASHLCGVYFQTNTDTRFAFVPYRGAAPANQDLIAGQIDLLCPEASNSLPLMKSGKVKAFAVLSKTRWAAAPDVPTIDEAGLPGLHIPFWHGFFVPAGTSREIIAKLNSAAVAALSDPALRQRLIDMGQEIPRRDRQTPEAFGAFQRAEIDKWWPVIRAANVKPE